MKYKRFGSRMVLRIDQGEEVLTQLHRAAEQEGIRLAAVSGLGAVGDFTVGVFHTAEKQYHAHRFQGDFEIVSLVGTITTKDGETQQKKQTAQPGKVCLPLSVAVLRADLCRHRGSVGTVFQGGYHLCQRQRPLLP